MQIGANLKKLPKFGLWAATRPHEGGITSNRRSECYGEFVPRLCTHRPSHVGSQFYLKFTILTLKI
jgi:hypothetical protein